MRFPTLLRLSFLVALAAALGHLTGSCGLSPTGSEPPRAVIFVVLDNVRADRLSLCGYGRPTSPFLEELRQAGAAITCDAKAPSTWTYPSHASFFTGTELPVHSAGMGETPDSVRFDWGIQARPLGPELPTLAEAMAARGYSTIMLSGNPVLSPHAGLARGFEEASVAERFGELYGPHLVRELRRLLTGETANDGRPLFLFVNISDAHQPWWRIPAKIDWLPERPRLAFHVDPRKGNTERQGYVKGTLDPEAAEALLAHLSDVYDYAVRRADTTLRGVVRALDEVGWLADGYRLVVTSDHGELLGEHRLLGHDGPYVYESLMQVPLVIAGSDPVPDLPSPISAIEAFDLALDGTLAQRPVRSAAYASPTWTRWFGAKIGGQPGAAIWDGNQKLVWQRGAFHLYDLDADPRELSATPLGGHPLRDDLLTLALAVKASVNHPVETSPELTEQLEALGYLAR